MRRGDANLIQISASISKRELRSLDKNSRESVLPRSGYIRKLISDDIKKHVKK